jgi:hypothetical protein
MPNCHEMKKGDVYTCLDCGLELQVIKECKDYGNPPDRRSCHTSGGACSFSCCGKDLAKKQSG